MYPLTSCMTLQLLVEHLKDFKRDHLVKACFKTVTYEYTFESFTIQSTFIMLSNYTVL
jgi:ribonucleotide reductase beta subunit family protein with ferritin-like domain